MNKVVFSTAFRGTIALAFVITAFGCTQQAPPPEEEVKQEIVDAPAPVDEPPAAASAEEEEKDAVADTPVPEEEEPLAVAEPSGEEVVIMLPGDVPLVLTHVPAGVYRRGRTPNEQDSMEREEPRHQVTLTQDFYMGKYPVTQAQWEAVMDSWPAAPPSEEYGASDDHPAYFVSWEDAQAFIAALNAHISETDQGPATVRLPTEAEWEYACRAGTITRFYWGDDPDYREIDEHAWYLGNEDTAMPVGLKTPNAWGLHDMSGNTFEWCQDWYDTYPSGPVTDPTGPDAGSFRVGRGGAWHRGALFCRSAFRGSFAPDVRQNYLGFRVAR